MSVTSRRKFFMHTYICHVSLIEYTQGKNWVSQTKPEMPSCLPAYDVVPHHPPIHGQVRKSAGGDSEESKGWRQSLACRNGSDGLSWVGLQQSHLRRVFEQPWRPTAWLSPSVGHYCCRVNISVIFHDFQDTGKPQSQTPRRS